MRSILESRIRFGIRNYMLSRIRIRNKKNRSRSATLPYVVYRYSSMFKVVDLHRNTFDVTPTERLMGTGNLWSPNLKMADPRRSRISQPVSKARTFFGPLPTLFFIFNFFISGVPYLSDPTELQYSSVFEIFIRYGKQSDNPALLLYSIH